MNEQKLIEVLSKLNDNIETLNKRLTLISILNNNITTLIDRNEKLINTVLYLDGEFKYALASDSEFKSEKSDSQARVIL